MREAVLVVRERSPTICQRIGKWCSEASRCRAWTERSILFQVMVGITGASQCTSRVVASVANNCRVFYDEAIISHTAIAACAAGSVG